MVAADGYRRRHPVEIGAPGRVALVDAGPAGEAPAARVMLADFADALAAYARASSSEPPALEQMGTGAGGRLAHTDAERAGACDAAVIGYAVRPGATPDQLAALLRQIREEKVLGPGARVYALAVSLVYEPEGAYASLRALANASEAAGARWCGAAVAGGGEIVCPCARSPRMGTLRRARSEATDRLIAAVRLGTNVDQALALAGGSGRPDAPDMALARCPLPRALYRLATRLLARR